MIQRILNRKQDFSLKLSLAGEGWVRRNQISLFFNILFPITLRIRNKVYFTSPLGNCSYIARHPCSRPPPSPLAREGLGAESSYGFNTLSNLQKNLNITSGMEFWFDGYKKGNLQ